MTECYLRDLVAWHTDFRVRAGRATDAEERPRCDTRRLPHLSTMVAMNSVGSHTTG